MRSIAERDAAKAIALGAVNEFASGADTLIAGAGHWALGSIDWRLLASLLVGSIPGIMIGSQLAARAPEYMTKPNMTPTRISGLPGIMEDAVKFKYIPAPLNDAQLKQAFPVEALK